MLKTVKSKFIFFTILFILLSVGIPTTFLFYQFRQNFEQRSKIMLNSTIEVVQLGINNAMMAGANKNVQKIIENVALNRNIDHIRIFNEGRIILYSSNREEINDNIDQVAPHHVVLDEIVSSNNFQLNKRGIYSAARPIKNEPNCQRCHKNVENIAYLDIDTRFTDAERKFYTGSLHIIFLGILIVIILTFGFYFLFNQLINKPLLRFREALDEVENRNLNVRLPAKKDNEFGHLESHFNKMVEKLKTSQQKIDEMHFEQLERADKLVTLGELAAEMAHEINNPTGIILSRADYLQMQSVSNSAMEKYNEDLEVIINQILKISKITNSILKYSRKLPKNFSNIDLVQIANESLTILEPRIIKKKITLVKKFEVDKIIIYGDALQIDQIITNLINNAIDAMEEYGILTLKLNIEDEKQICFSITDTGCGIDENSLNHIFSPFYTSKADGNGTGLGLYIVKNICKNHNADISCTSSPGKGTTFKIIFNLNQLPS